MKKALIDIVTEQMIDALEKPREEIIAGKKHFILQGDFMTIEAEAIVADGLPSRAFIVSGDRDKEPSFFVQIHQVDTHKMETFKT